MLDFGEKKHYICEIGGLHTFLKIVREFFNSRHYVFCYRSVNVIATHSGSSRNQYIL